MAQRRPGEIETANLFLGAICQGTFKQLQNGSYQLYHVSWTFDANGAYSGYWEEHLTATVAQNGKTYTGKTSTTRIATSSSKTTAP